MSLGHSQGGQGRELVAGTSLISLVHLISWVGYSQPICGHIETTGKQEVLKIYNQEASWRVDDEPRVSALSLETDRMETFDRPLGKKLQSFPCLLSHLTVSLTARISDQHFIPLVAGIERSEVPRISYQGSPTAWALVRGDIREKRGADSVLTQHQD